MKYQKILFGLFAATCVGLSLLVIMPSGRRDCVESRCGDYYYGAHEHDGVWHIAVTEMMLQTRKWQMPSFAGESLAGYNYGIDVLVAGLSALTNGSTKDWFFRGLPILWGVGMLYYLSLFAKRYRQTPSFAWFLLTMCFLGSSFSYLLKLYHTGSIWGGSGQLSMQALQVMTNPQLGLSLLILVIFLTRRMGGQRKHGWREGLINGMLLAGALALKFYTGLIMVGMLALSLLFDLKATAKKGRVIGSYLLTGVWAIAVVFWLYLPSGKSFPLVWEPFAPVTPIVEEAQLFYLPLLAERLYTTAGLPLFILYLVVTVIFIVMNYGVRIVALFTPWLKLKKQEGHVRTLLGFGSVLGLLLSILFVQRGIWWNTVQFLHVSLFLSGILAAEVLDSFYVSAKVMSKKIIIVLGLGALLLPNNLDIVRTFASKSTASYVPDAEISALSYLKSLPGETVFAPAFRRDHQGGVTTTLPTRLDTAYVTAYSGKVSYFADITQLELLSIPYQTRQSLSENYDCTILDNVDYLYLPKAMGEVAGFSKCPRPLTLVFDNEAAQIYQVD